MKIITPDEVAARQTENAKVERLIDHVAISINIELRAQAVGPPYRIRSAEITQLQTLPAEVAESVIQEVRRRVVEAGWNVTIERDVWVVTPA